MHAYSGRLKRIAMRVVRNEADAEEVVQDSFLQAFRNLAVYRHECALATWLFRIAFNQAVMTLRKRRSSRSDVMEELQNGPHHSAVSYETPEDICAFEEQQRIVRECLRQVPERFRVPLDMRANTGLSYNEIARALDMRESTVKVMVHRGRGKLRRLVRMRVRKAA